MSKQDVYICLQIGKSIFTCCEEILYIFTFTEILSGLNLSEGDNTLSIGSTWGLVSRTRLCFYIWFCFEVFSLELRLQHWFITFLSRKRWNLMRMKLESWTNGNDGTVCNHMWCLSWGFWFMVSTYVPLWSLRTSMSLGRDNVIRVHFVMDLEGFHPCWIRASLAPSGKMWHSSGKLDIAYPLRNEFL